MEVKVTYLGNGCHMQEYENGRRYWFKKSTNTLHRLDGPAVEYPNGYKEYWVDGVYWSRPPTKEEILCKDIIE